MTGRYLQPNDISNHTDVIKWTRIYSTDLLDEKIFWVLLIGDNHVLQKITR